VSTTLSPSDDVVYAPTPAARQRYRRLIRALRRNPLAVFGFAIIAVLVAFAVLAPLLVTHSPTQPDPSTTFAAPSAAHWLGTDSLGYDVFSRLVYGARVSLGMAVLSVGTGAVIGVLLGSVSGYFRGIVGDHVIMRIADAFQAMPALILALGLTAALGQSFTTAAFAIGIAFVPHFIRITRAQALVARESQFVEAARVAGAGDWWILRHHVLPSALGPIIIQATVAMGTAMLLEAGLSYLGVGIRPPTASWGGDLRTAQSFLFQAPWLAICPGVAIFLGVLAFNMIGDGLRDALDARGQTAG
jgi:peptide/nickel transport system permease protein